MRSHKVALVICSKRERSLNVLYRELWEVGKDVLVGHTRGKPSENIVYRDAHVPDTRLAPSFPRVDRDALTVMLHDPTKIPMVR